jgi:hypothetical protein
MKTDHLGRAFSSIKIHPQILIELNHISEHELNDS